ncbi:T-complex protein 1 subunit theta-like [Oppia nitens]|uniref:T-complex protein 1 subunit theta-like n=1 Tax=Oppia nitens TaxID=1686743 RepID=UPI0023DABD85|nr:T-complex protein 1 subunit theta-like [Oppia nitens]
MALSVPKAPGFLQMLKDGTKYLSGIEEAVIRNIEACTELSNALKTGYGPKGLNKMIINHLEKLFVTSDAATVIREMEVQHPTARMIIQASQMMEHEVGDGTNFIVLFAGALLENAEELIRMGLKPTEIIDGYEIAANKVLDELLPKLTVHEVKEFKDLNEVSKAIRSSVMSKQYGSEDFLTKLIAEACISVGVNDVAFNVDNIRICKILGAGVEKSEVVQGMVFKKLVEGDISLAENAKIAIYTGAVDTQATETKGTVLIKSADELLNFSRGEENLLEAQIKAIAESGAKVVVSGGKFGDLALHYCNKYNLLAVRLNSKFDIRRVAKTVNAIPLPKLTAPNKEELGFCDKVYIDEIGGTNVVVFEQKSKESRIATIVIRGSTDNIMDDIERCIDDGINTFKALTRDGRLVAGAGAVEMELAHQISQFAETLPGLEQYSVGKFADSLQSLTVALADNAGIKSTELVALLQTAHANGKSNTGIDIESDVAATIDSVNANIYDLQLVKHWGIKYATNVANTILQVDQIICAKPAGGPKPPKQGGDWDQD